VPEPTLEGIRYTKIGAGYIKRALPFTHVQRLGKFAEKYTGKKRQRYLDAVDHVLEKGIVREDSDVSMFIKCEKIDPTVKVNPDPRPVQFRNAKYCVVLAAYLKPIERHLYRLKLHHRNMPRVRVIAKGLNQPERAQLLVRKLSYFKNPIILSLDMSRFDQHVDVALLRVEHGVYKHCNSDPLLAQILDWQCINKVKTSTGIRYTTLGKRMSGDMNTALGNCIIMISMTVGVMTQLNVFFDILDDGDDCLLIVEKENVAMVKSKLPDMFLHCGHELKIENETSNIYEVAFCQSKPIETHLGLKFVRDPIKVMSCCLVGRRWTTAPKWLRLAYVSGLGECELILNIGVPVLQSYALALLRNSEGAQARYDTESGEWLRALRESRLYKHLKMEDGTYDLTITDDARRSFELAFGITINRQLQMEHYLDNWTFNVGGNTECSSTWNPLTWENDRETFPEIGDL